MKGRAIATNNAVLDSFELQKKGPGAPATTLAQIYPEEALKITFEAPPSLTPGLASAPGTDAAAQAIFTIHPMKAGDQPVQFEISHAGVRPIHQLEGGPLRVIAPTLTGPTRVVWARVRAVGGLKWN